MTRRTVIGARWGEWMAVVLTLSCGHEVTRPRATHGSPGGWRGRGRAKQVECRECAVHDSRIVNAERKVS